MTNEAWEDYVKNLSKSSGAVWRVAMYLHRFKYTVTIPALHIAKDLSEYKSKIDDGDIILHRDGNQEKIEVKHQSWDWTNHTDIPWNTIIVCAKKSYDRHNQKPSAYFLVNTQLTHAIYGEDPAKFKGKGDNKYKLAWLIPIHFIEEQALLIQDIEP